MNQELIRARGDVMHWREEVPLLREPSVFLGEEKAVEINGRKFHPDRTKGYLEFWLAHAYPVVNAYGKAFHAGTVANSWTSMQHQGFNIGHLVKQYLKGERELPGDRYIGSILEVEYPRTPMGGWRLTDYEHSPGMRCVACFAKQAHGVDRILGEHQAGRHQWAVSLEADYWMDESGVLFTNSGTGKVKELPEKMRELCAAHTPEDLQKADHWYLPVPETPEEVLETFTFEQGFTKEFWGRRAVLLMGGVNGQVHFKGAAIVRYGAEPTARIESVLASAPEAADWDAARAGLAKSTLPSVLLCPETARNVHHARKGLTRFGKCAWKGSVIAI